MWESPKGTLLLNDEELGPTIGRQVALADAISPTASRTVDVVELHILHYSGSVSVNNLGVSVQTDAATLSRSL